MLFLLVFLTLEPLFSVSLGIANTHCHTACLLESEIPQSTEIPADSCTDSVEDNKEGAPSDNHSERCNPLTSCSCCSILPAVISWKTLQPSTRQPLVSYPEPLPIVGKNFKNLWQPPQLR
jgi:hypothetical protein